jgi:hypothetical protein
VSGTPGDRLGLFVFFVSTGDLHFREGASRLLCVLRRPGMRLRLVMRCHSPASRISDAMHALRSETVKPGGDESERWERTEYNWMKTSESETERRDQNSGNEQSGSEPE